MVPPGLRRPSRSAASIMRSATRSLIEPPGLKTSTFATSWQRRSGSSRVRRTIGVWPTVSRIESTITARRLRPRDAQGRRMGQRLQDDAVALGQLEELVDALRLGVRVEVEAEPDRAEAYGRLPVDA